jgi:hypothetical protein
MTRHALYHRYSKKTYETMMQPAKIHFAMSKLTLGLTMPDHLLKARRLTAVKASAA